MSVSTHPPSGFRDFIKDEARRRYELMERISSVYRSFGFDAIESPALENLNILIGSGGGNENEKLIFKVMKRGDKLKEVLASQPTEDAIADFGLRFDLTVPLARIVAECRGQIHLPWKVFHIGPVWRAERSQRGRFREFVQCDVDIVGAKTCAAEIEVIQAVVSAVHAVGGSGFELRMSDRRILQGLADKHSLSPEDLAEFAILLDKKDKVEPAELRDEMKKLLGSKFDSELEALLRGELSLQSLSGASAQAVHDLETIMGALKAVDLPLTGVHFDSSLVRGMGYYTGPVFELRHSSAGYSFGGGGRYDQMIGRFTKESIPACGFSIGFERLALLLKEQEELTTSKRIFVPVFDEKLRPQVLQIARDLRGAGFEVDVYADEAKLKSQFRYASEARLRFVLILGEDELKSQTFKVKDFETGNEEAVSASSLINFMRSRLSAPKA